MSLILHGIHLCVCMHVHMCSSMKKQLRLGYHCTVNWVTPRILQPWMQQTTNWNYSGGKKTMSKFNLHHLFYIWNLHACGLWCPLHLKKSKSIYPSLGRRNWPLLWLRDSNKIAEDKAKCIKGTERIWVRAWKLTWISDCWEWSLDNFHLQTLMHSKSSGLLT